MGVIGSPIQKYVAKQIKKRQEIHGNGVLDTRSINQISYLNSRNAWIKFGSSVYVNDDDNGKDRLKKMGLSNSYLGNRLARHWVLFNGIGKKGNRAGIEGDNNSNGAYGVGGLDFGYAPMPGITEMNAESLNRGSLKQITITLKCYNSQQLNIIDTLYMRLGFTVFLEWGWDKYIPNDSNEIENNNYSLMDEFLPYNAPQKAQVDSPNVYDNAEVELRAKIFENRAKSHGNYDAVIAKICNFSWSVSPDGTYDITISLMSKGDIIESLKINAPPAINSVYFDSVLSELAVGRGIYRYSIDSMPFLFARNAHKGKTRWDAWMTELKMFNSTPKGGAYIEKQQKNHPIMAGNIIKKNPIHNYGWANVIASIDKLRLLGYPYNNNGDFAKQVTKMIFNTGGVLNNLVVIKHGGNGLYIRLGSFLEFLQEVCIPKTDGGVPLLKIFHKHENLPKYGIHNPCYTISDQQISLDPRVCLIPNHNFISYSEGESVLNSLFFQFNTINRSVENGLEPFHNQYDGVNFGNMMNIYISAEFINDELFGGDDSKGDVYLGPTLDKLCSSINKALGGVNKLEPVIDEENNIIQIIDNAVIPNKEKLYPVWYGVDGKKLPVKEYYKLELVGYNEISGSITSNFVKDVQMETAITPEYADMITIGATGGGYTPGTESTAFSKWNTGLTDRYKTKIYDPQLKTEPATIEPPLSEYKATVDEYDTFLNSDRWNIIGVKRTILENGQVNPIDDGIVSSNLDTVTDYWKFLHASMSLAEDKPSNQTGFIPFNLTIDLDGLAGVKIYDKLEIDIGFLPSNYPKSLDFIITKVNSTVMDNIWTTSLETMCIARSAEVKGNWKRQVTPSTPSTTSAPTGIVERRGSGKPKADELARAKVRMKLKRILDDGLQTLGILQVYDENGKELYELKTVELPYKSNENSKSCIPPAKYLVRSAYTTSRPAGSGYGPYLHHFRFIGNEFSSPDPYYKIPSGGPEDIRDGILMHRCVASNELLGCIAPGTAFSTKLTGRVKGPGGNVKGNPRGILSLKDSRETMERLMGTFYTPGDNSVAKDTSFYIEIFNDPNGLRTDPFSDTELNQIHIGDLTL